MIYFVVSYCGLCIMPMGNHAPWSVYQMSTTTKPTTKPTKPTTKENAMSGTALDTLPADINGVTVNLPNRFAAMVGQPLTADFAKIVFTHVAGQFRNNQVANAKARADRRAKADNDADRTANDPLTVDDYLKIWADYMPQVGGGPRQSSTEKLRYEAARRAWVQLIADHNAAIDAGQTPILKTTEKQAVAARPVKTKAVSTEAHEAAVTAWQDKQDAIYKRLLETPAYADRVQVQLDALMAEQGKGKAEAAAAEASADLI